MKTLELVLYRGQKTNTYTEGELYINGVFFCYTIEDKVRAKVGMWNKLLKVYAETAIPYGKYPVLVTWSNRFKRMLTGIFAVPDFDGIRMHNGTSAKSSAGCVILSYKRMGPGWVVNDVSAMNELCNRVTEAQKTSKIFITITDKL